MKETGKKNPHINSSHNGFDSGYDRQLHKIAMWRNARCGQATRCDVMTQYSVRFWRVDFNFQENGCQN